MKLKKLEVFRGLNNRRNLSYFGAAICSLLIYLAGAVAESPSERNATIKLFIRTQGQATVLDPKSANLAASEIFKKLDHGDDPPEHVRLMRTLMKLIADGSLDAENEAIIRKRMYNALEAPSDIERSYAIFAVAHLDGESSLMAVAPRLADPTEMVRIDAERVFGTFGNATDLGVLKEALEKRAATLSANAIEWDHSFKYGKMAIEKIRARQGNDPANKKPSSK